MNENNITISEKEYARLKECEIRLALIHDKLAKDKGRYGLDSETVSVIRFAAECEKEEGGDE